MRMKRTFAALLCAMLLITLLPGVALADEKELSFTPDPTTSNSDVRIVVEPDGDGWKATRINTTVPAGAHGAMTDTLKILGPTGVNNTIEVKAVGTDTAPLLLKVDDVQCTVTDATGRPLALAAGSHVKLSVGRDSGFRMFGTDARTNAAITVPETATLVISGPGKLTAIVNAADAAIGNKSGEKCGTIVFDDANVEATSTGTSVAIGGTGGTVLFTGGIVTATGGDGQPAIDAGSVSILPAEGKALATRVSDTAVSNWSSIDPLAFTIHGHSYSYINRSRYAQIRESAVKVGASPAGSVAIGTAVTLTATLTNIANPTYQWYSNSIDSSMGGDIITGETNATYQPPTTAVGTIYYYCIVGGITSNVVPVTVTGPGGAEIYGDVGPDVPKTGDNTPLALFGALMLLCGAGLAMRRTRRKKEAGQL